MVDLREAGATAGGSVASEAQHCWILDFVLDVAAEGRRPQPECGIQVAIPVAMKALLTSGLRRQKKFPRPSEIG